MADKFGQTRKNCIMEMRDLENLEEPIGSWMCGDSLNSPKKGYHSWSHNRCVMGTILLKVSEIMTDSPKDLILKDCKSLGKIVVPVEIKKIKQVNLDIRPVITTLATSKT